MKVGYQMAVSGTVGLVFPAKGLGTSYGRQSQVRCRQDDHPDTMEI